MSEVTKPSRTPSGRPIRYGAYPELTWPAILVGWFLGAMIAISIGYVSLILGFSIEGSELAAILGWSILRGAMRRASIIENNINQTIASAVNGASAGMMFSVPALFILAAERKESAAEYAALTEFSPVLMVIACIVGGILGLAFVIPLRKQMIDFDRLAYPGGIAVATILKSPGAGIRKARLLLLGILISGLFYGGFALQIDPEHPGVPVGEYLQLPPYLNVTFFLSLMTVGVGFLSGRGGLWFGLGGFICYWFLAPLLGQFGGEGIEPLLQSPAQLKNALFRPTGIGMLIGAAVGGIIGAMPLIASAFRSLHESSRSGSGSEAGQRDELSIGLLYALVAGGTIALMVVCYFTVPQMSPARAALMSLLGAFWVWVAGVIVSECVGRTNWSPLSGMTLIAVTILLVLASSGMPPVPAILSSVILGAAICVAIAQAGDMMLDLKSGYLVGAVPRRQQIAQFIGAWLGPIIVMVLIYVLHQQYGLGSKALPAPQGEALASMVDSITRGDVPTYRYTAGAVLGLLLALSGLGGIGVLIGLGFYMPFDIVLTYTIGNFARMVCDRVKGPTFTEESAVPLAAGLIVGEALVGVGNAMIHVFGGAGS